MLTVGTWGFFTLTWSPGSPTRPSPSSCCSGAPRSSSLPSRAAVARSVCRHLDSYIQNTVIVGAGHVGQSVAHKLLQHPEYGVNLVGFVDEHPRERRDDLYELTLVGKVSELPQLVRALDIERVIIAFSRAPHTQALAIIRELNALDVQVDMVPRMFEVLGPHATIHGAEGIPLLGLPPARLPWSSLVIKRAMDIVVSSIALILLTPLFALIALAIKLDSPGRVLFRQVRMGKGDRPFRILKFRTMTRRRRRAQARRRAPEQAHRRRRPDVQDPRRPRVTRVGRFLRRYSLDEFPQLINVLKGDMSLVGARPLIPDEHRHVDGGDRGDSTSSPE